MKRVSPTSVIDIPSCIEYAGPCCVEILTAYKWSKKHDGMIYVDDEVSPELRVVLQFDGSFTELEPSEE